MIRAAVACLLALAIASAALASAAAAAPTNPAVQLAALSCASLGNCSAVGTYADALGDSQALLASEMDGKWRRAARGRAPAGASFDPFRAAEGGSLTDISCPAAGDCTAIGRYTDSAGIDHGVLFTETGGRWGRGMRIRLPGNAIAPRKPRTGVSDNLGLAAISCSSAGNCVAVGHYETTAEVWEPMILVEAQGRWARALQAPLPPGAAVAGQNAALLTTTCSTTGTCSTAGYYVDTAGHQQALLISGAGGSWQAAPTPSPPSDAAVDPNIVLSSIACAGTGECAAVGTYVNPLQNSLGLLLSEHAGAWAGGSGVTLPGNAAPATTVGDQTAVLSSAACPQVGLCTAVGWYFDNDENGQGLLVNERNGQWQPGVEISLPANAVGGLEKQSAGLDWISCASVDNCLATGVYTDAGYNSQGLLLPEVNGVWQTGIESPLPRNAGNTQYAAANQSDCTGAGNCAVIGQYTNYHGQLLGYTLSESGGTWSRAAELGLPGPDSAELKLSLDRILIPLAGKAGRLEQIRKQRRYAFEYPAIEPGMATSAWYSREHGQVLLIGAGKVRVRRAGDVKLNLELTRAGATLLAHLRRLQITATARFTPRGRQRAQTATARFTLS